MNFTLEQQQAITEEGKNIIVSAGAGSGKTAVLTERVLRKLKSGIHINALLILTFTNAAAAEMKSRIRKEVMKDSSLKEEADLLDGAYITTFDAFSLSMVKKYHAKLNISSHIEVADEVMIDIAKNKILDDIMEENYQLPKQGFMKLIEDFCLKDDEELKKNILNIYQKIELKYNKKEYLEHFFETYYTKEKIMESKKDYFSLIDSYRKEIESLLEELASYFDSSYIEKLEASLSSFLQAKNYQEIKDCLAISLPRVPKGSSEEGKNIKGMIGTIFSDIKDLCIYETEEEMEQEIFSTKQNAEEIIHIIKELDDRLTEYKRQNEIYNFTDIAHLAIQVVEENEDIREELRDSFQEILIDEYQDTSDTQEKLISLISKNNVYMVGDIKQSIYRFRNANPYIFKNKYELYQKEEEGIKIDLVKNFRSRQEVLNNINLIFDLCMNDEFGGANYSQSHRMVFGNDAYTTKGKTNQHYDLDVFCYQKPENNISNQEQEAFIIGEDILKKQKERFQVFDKDKKQLRPMEYKDIVILLDQSKDFDLYKKVFEYLHIPLTIVKEESLHKDYDILVIKNLLKLLIDIKNHDFSNEFSYHFISVARSFLYRMSDEEIFEYHNKKNYQDSLLYQKCFALIDKMDVMSVSSYLNYVLDCFGYEEKLITMGNVKSFRIREQYFYELCRNLEKKGNTIYDFVSYLDCIYEKDYDVRFSVNTSDSNSCKIMTIHKSKGLEYPICYFAGFTREFNFMELKEKILYDNQYGLILPKVDQYYKDTILKTLVKRKTKKEEISEKIRLLYVALTRAREQMVIVIPEQEEILGIPNDYEKMKYRSFLSIIKSIYGSLVPYQKRSMVQATQAYLDSNPEKEVPSLQEEKDILKVEELSFAIESLEEKHYSKDQMHLITKEEQERMDFGTKVHEVLEHLDFNNPDFYMFSISDDMKEKILAFLHSPLIQENLSKKMYREYEFLFEERNVLSHGMIDLLIERDDKMIIVDYKLKNIEDSLYEEQLNGYRKVIGEKTKKEVECYLYSILEGKFRKIEI